MKRIKIISGLLLAAMLVLSTVFTGCKKDDDNNPPANETGTFTDSRDGHVYNWVKIGGQVWMAENLAYKPRTAGYLAYDNNEDNVAVYGYLYEWNLAQTIAPDGWHLPSQAEWQTLVDYLGGSDKAYNKLLEKGTAHWGSPNDATNESGFTALPSGYYDTRYDEFGHMGELTEFHSTTEYPGDNTAAIGLVLIQNFKEATVEGRPKAIYLPIRCVRD